MSRGWDQIVHTSTNSMGWANEESSLKLPKESLGDLTDIITKQFF